jgi:pimeloyl-ACP methyl ester carboxylesterase
VQRTIWGNNGGVRIEAIEWSPEVEPSAQGVPLVFLAGGTGNARSGEVHAAAAASGRLGTRPRRLLGISRRGMGLSDAPPSGFAPADFAGDVRAAVAAAGYERFALFGHSMGVPISIELALRDPAGLAGLALGDAPARYIDFKADGTFDSILSWPSDFASWDEAFDRLFRNAGRTSANRVVFDKIKHREFIERDGRIRSFVGREALVRTVDESVTAHVDYRPRLGEIGCPVLLLVASSGWSPLRPADLAAYEDRVRDLTIARLESGHDLGQFGDPGPLHAALGALLDRVDG